MIVGELIKRLSYYNPDIQVQFTVCLPDDETWDSPTQTRDIESLDTYALFPGNRQAPVVCITPGEDTDRIMREQQLRGGEVLALQRGQ